MQIKTYSIINTILSNIKALTILAADGLLKVGVESGIEAGGW